MCTKNLGSVVEGALMLLSIIKTLPFQSHTKISVRHIFILKQLFHSLSLIRLSMSYIFYFPVNVKCRGFKSGTPHLWLALNFFILQNTETIF